MTSFAGGALRPQPGGDSESSCHWRAHVLTRLEAVHLSRLSLAATRLSTTLIKGLRVTGGRAKSVAIKHGKLVVTLKKPAGTVTITASGPLVSETKGLQTKVKKHKTKTFRRGAAGRPWSNASAAETDAAASLQAAHPHLASSRTSPPRVKPHIPTGATKLPLDPLRRGEWRFTRA